MLSLRTADDRFVDLPGYDFAPHYAEIADTEGGTLRVHYLDESHADEASETVLLLHGEPSWSYLYRHMIGPLVDAGHRVVVPDQVGCGRSDKPAAQGDYTYARHVSWMSELIFDQLDLQNITLFAQDWGGLVGLRLVAAQPERFARLAVSNTGLPDGRHRASEAFLQWQAFSQSTPDFDAGAVLQMGTLTELDELVVAAYNAPFPDDSFKSGVRVWPALVPTSTDDPESAANIAAWEALSAFDRPVLCCFSDGDPVTAGGEQIFMHKMPGAAGQQHQTVVGGGHFVQEDQGPELARILVDFISDS